MVNLNHNNKVILGLLFVFCFCGCLQADPTPTWPQKDETPAQRNARMQWWRDARFGMFIHWGVYSVPAGTYKGKQIEFIGEWIMQRGKIPVAEYKEFAKEFNPVKYDPDAWVRMAKDAGMKYIVITAKHHDGFALFDTKASDWNIVQKTPYGKDILKPLAEACRKHGIKLGFYYSQAQDWTHPGGSANGGHWDKAQEGDMDAFIKNISVPQIRELFTNYGDIAVLWWDTPIDMTPKRAAMFNGLLELQPGIITNDRLLKGHGGDLKTPEQHVPATGFDYDWEACMTMNTTWGYKSYDHDWKSSKQLIRHLVDIASKGGNYLLNVGPMATGEIPQASIDRLKDIGEWMEVNSESIYGTTASPFVRLKWGRCTKKEYANASKLYLHVFDWPEDGRLAVEGLHSEVIGAYFMADFQQHLNVEKTDSGVVIHLPEKPLDDVDTVIVVKIKGDLLVERILPRQDTAGVLNLTINDINIHNPSYGGKIVIETNEQNLKHLGGWTDHRSRVDWLVQIDQPGEFDVYAEIASKKAAGFTLFVDKSKKSFDAPATGEFEDFKRIRIGKLKLTKGEHTIKISPLAKKWNPINLRSISFEPAKTKEID